MENWLFALIVFGFGFFLAILVDRMRARTRVPGTPRNRTDKEREKSKWLSYWYTGRFPSKEDLDREEEEAEEEEGAEEEAAEGPDGGDSSQDATPKKDANPPGKRGPKF